MTKKDYKLESCPMCKTVHTTDNPRPGVQCPNPSCESYLELVLKGRKKGSLRWHHPIECEEETEDLCVDVGPCAIYMAIGTA